MLVALQLSVLGLYLPPVAQKFEESLPPQTIISVPVHTAVWPPRAEGALDVAVAVQVLSMHSLTVSERDIEGSA